MWVNVHSTDVGPRTQNALNSNLLKKLNNKQVYYKDNLVYIRESVDSM